MPENSKAREIADALAGRLDAPLPDAVVKQLIGLLQSITATQARALPPELMSPAERRLHTLAMVRAERRDRRERREHFSPAMFGEPAWDLLLLSYIHHAEDEPLALSQAAELIGHPLTTTIRWVEYLEQCGLMQRQRQEGDRRVVIISPTLRALAKVEDYFWRDGSAASIDNVMGRSALDGAH